MNPALRWIALGCVTLAATGCMNLGEMDDGPVAEGVSGRLGDPIPSATAEQLATFERGRQVALKRFDLADGLGPAFNVTFCAACHERPTVGGSAALYRNFFLSGLRTQDGAFVFGQSAGMAGGVIRVFSYAPDLPARPVVPPETTIFAQRNAIPMFGVGLIAELDEDEILSRADPDDADGDGISGRPNFDRGFVGRFGRKSQTVSIEGFIRGPLFNHMGVTTIPLSDEQRRQLPVDSSLTAKRLARVLQAAAPDVPNFDDDGVPDPEMSQEELFDLVSFSMLLAAPQLEPPTAQSNRGRLLFHDAGCSDCHVPRLNGPRGPLPVYSDLLLHDMGEGLADGIVQGEATGSEFRTQPLWGLAAVGPYLHDGRADTIEDAILWHGGEAQRARDAFAAMTEAQKDDVIEFLLSLGGRIQASSGLLEPDEPIPAIGAYGGPLRQLSQAETQQFLRGRELFDRDFGMSAGVGGMTGADGDPRFNGDSCRACHFDPVIGGAGPRDVNVMRHAIVAEDGRFTRPPTTVNTILHKEVIVGFNPAEPTPDVNTFEHRQTPHLFGLGLIDAIADETIIANADPFDADGDGISGRAHVLPDDGRLGRFGWKADVPSLAEFVRDGMAAELGITVEAQPGLTFGITEDNDDVADPELSAAQAEDLAFFLRMLAGPPRQAVSAEETDRILAGDALFEFVGCTKCHIPSLPSPLGDVPLYSNLLLHDILPPLARGIESGDASQTEFRTAPLWGLSKTAPYFHDGRADTIEQAIQMHDGEAASVRQAYNDLSDESRAAIIHFLNSL